jgi:hypothetical protein
VVEVEIRPGDGPDLFVGQGRVFPEDDAADLYLRRGSA